MPKVILRCTVNLDSACYEALCQETKYQGRLGIHACHLRWADTPTCQKGHQAQAQAQATRIFYSLPRLSAVTPNTPCHSSGPISRAEWPPELPLLLSPHSHDEAGAQAP